MKQFFKDTLSSLFALFIFSIFSILIIMAIVSQLYDVEQTIVKPNSILEIKFDKPILDRVSDNPFLELNALSFSFQENMELMDILDNINKARDHHNIKGIYLNVSSLEAGFSQVEEIRNKLLEFKKSGKFIYAYSESFSQNAYYLASAADKIYLNPEGYVELYGISAGVMFYKDLLNKVGVEAQVIRHGKYKSAVEPYMYNAMSQDNREQLERLLNSITNKIISDISYSRSVSETRIHEVMNKLELSSAYNAKDLLFIDEIYYEDEVMDRINQEGSYNLISYIDFERVNIVRDNLTEDKIAIIYAIGDINTGEGSFNSIGSETIVKAIRKAKEDSNVKAIVLRVNSPGGSALASDIIWRELSLAKKKKKVVVSMGDYAASGGYYISCNADKIFANVTTITGSIGVFGIVPNSQRLLNDKLGIYIDTVNTHKYSDIGSGSRRLTAYETSIIQRSIEEVYDTFISHVAEGREISKQDVDRVGQGRVWSGVDALDIGLIDEIGGIEDAIVGAAHLAELTDYRIITLPEKEDFLEDLINSLSTRSNVELPEFLGVSKEIIRNIQSLYSEEIIQARMPFFLDMH